MGVHLTGVHLTSVHLMGGCLMGVYLVPHGRTPHRRVLLWTCIDSQIQKGSELQNTSFYASCGVVPYCARNRIHAHLGAKVSEKVARFRYLFWALAPSFYDFEPPFLTISTSVFSLTLHPHPAPPRPPTGTYFGSSISGLKMDFSRSTLWVVAGGIYGAGP